MAKKVIGINTNDLPKLTAAEIEKMLLLIKGGHNELREKFLLANSRLVLSSVQRYANSKESPDDLFQVGMLGLMKALDNFDVAQGVRFSTYAVPMILGEMRRFIREGTALKVGRSIRDVAYRAIIARDKLERASVQEASLAEIAEEAGISYREVVSALDAIAEPVSLYEPAYSDGEDSVEVIDQIKDPRADTDFAERLALRAGIDELPEREKTVIISRYYQGNTQMEIAEALELSQAQVSRLEKSAIERLRSCCL